MTTVTELKRWFETGRREKYSYMIVAYDSFSMEHYPIYASADDFWQKYSDHDEKKMQRIMESYDLTKSWEEQSGALVMNTPPR